MATDMLIAAEEHQGKREDIKVKVEWEKFDALLAKQLKIILVKTVNMLMEICTMEDKCLRKLKKQLPGLSIYNYFQKL